MEAVASSLKSENDIYIGTIIDQVLIFNQHSIQLISGLIDYAECRNSRFQKKEDAVFIDHISKNEGASMFSTKTRKKMSSKMKSRATSRQSRIAFKNRKKEANIKECLKHHLEHMFHYFLQIYPRLIEEIKFLDFENYFPLCKEIMTFFVNYVKLFYLKKHMYKPQEFITFRDYSKTFIRLVTPFIEKVTPIITEYLSYDPEKNDKRFDWDSIDIKSSYSPYKKNSSLYKFETNILINFRDVIDWIICILSLINTKKVVKEDSSEKKNQNIEDTFQFPEKFQPLLELMKKENIHFNITDDFRKNTKQQSKKKLKKQIENEQQKAKEEKMNLQVQVFTDKTKDKTKENTKTRNVESRKPKKSDREQLDPIRYAPDFLLPQNAYDFIDNYYVFMKPEDEKDQDKKDKEKEKAEKQEENSKKSQKNDNEDNIVTFHTPQMIMLNCALNSILPLIRQKDTSLYFNIPKALSALGLSSFEIMREFQNPKLDDVLYKHNELMLNISLVLSCVVSFIQASEEMTQTFFDFICERTCPLIYKIADSSSVNSDLTINILEAVYAIVNIVMDSKMSVHKQIQNQLEKECQDDNIYFSLIAVRISLLRILYCFLYLQSQSQLIGAFQMVQLLSQFYFNSNFIDNIEDLLMNVTRVEKMSFMLCNPLKFFSKFPDFKFQNNFFPAEIITRSMNFAFYNLEFGTRTIYVFNEETEDKNNNSPQNFNTLIELNKRVAKRMITFILTNIKEKQTHKDTEENKKEKKKEKEKEKGKEKNEKQLKANASSEAKIRRYYSNRTLTLIDELGFESISTENNLYVDFHELTKKAIRRAMKLQAKRAFIEINSKDKKDKKKDKKDKKKDDNKDEEKKRKEEEKEKKEEEKKEKEKEKEKEKKKKDGNNNKDKKKKNDKKAKGNENITNYEFINGDKLCKFIFEQLNFYSPSFYRNGYFIDVIRCCNKYIKRFYFNYFIGIENGAHDPIFNSIIEISKVIELLHPEAISEIALYSENDSMRQHIMDLVNEVVSVAISKSNNRNVNNGNNDDIGDINTKQLNILKIGRAHNFRQLLNVAVKISWRHTDPVITTNYGMLRKQTKCGISLHPGNDEKMFSISTNSPEIFEEYFPVLLCNILTKENFFHEDHIFFDTEKLCYPTYEFFPNGILYALCATYFHCPYEKSNGFNRKRIHEMTKKVLRLVHEKVYNEQMELLNKPEDEYNSNFIKLSRIQYRAYYFLGKAINLSPVLTNRDIENYFSPYFLDEAIKFLSKYDTKKWHKKEEEEEKMSKKQKDKIDTDFHFKRKNKNSQNDESSVRSCLDKFLKDTRSTNNDENTKNNKNAKNNKNTKNNENTKNNDNKVNNDAPKPEKRHNIIYDLLKSFTSPGLLNGVIEEEIPVEKVKAKSIETEEIIKGGIIEEEIVEIEEVKDEENPVEPEEMKGEEKADEEEKTDEIKEEKPDEEEKTDKPKEEKPDEEEKQGKSKKEKKDEEEKTDKPKEEKQDEEKKQGKSKEEKQDEEEKAGKPKEENTDEEEESTPIEKKILDLDKILEEENESNRNRYYRNFEDDFLFQSARNLSRVKQYAPRKRRATTFREYKKETQNAPSKPSTPEKTQPTEANDNGVPPVPEKNSEDTNPFAPDKEQPKETANNNGNSPLTRSLSDDTNLFAPDSPQQNEPNILNVNPRKIKSITLFSRNTASPITKEINDNVDDTPMDLSATTRPAPSQKKPSIFRKSKSTFEQPKNLFYQEQDQMKPNNK